MLHGLQPKKVIDYAKAFGAPLDVIENLEDLADDESFAKY
jgi:hypothetical protein